MLTHYHAVRVLGASAYDADQIIMSDTAHAMVEERGQEDWDSEFQRFPPLFEGHDSSPGLTNPTTTFSGTIRVYLGKRRVDIKHIGRAHTAGDAIIHVPDQNVMFTGDAYDVDAVAPGRGAAPVGKDAAERAMKGGSLKDAWDAVRAECDPKFKD